MKCIWHRHRVFAFSWWNSCTERLGASLFVLLRSGQLAHFLVSYSSRIKPQLRWVRTKSEVSHRLCFEFRKSLSAFQSLKRQLCIVQWLIQQKAMQSYAFESISILTMRNIFATTKNESSRLIFEAFVTFASLLSLCYFNHAASDIDIYWIFDAFVSLNVPFEHFHSGEIICSMMFELLHGNDVDLINSLW